MIRDWDRLDLHVFDEAVSERASNPVARGGSLAVLDAAAALHAHYREHGCGFLGADCAESARLWEEQAALVRSLSVRPIS